MAVGVHAPRVNNNDDVVKLIALSVAVGDRVARGDILAQVETDKAIVDVESPADGFVIGLTAQIDASVAVGSVLLWLGDTADQPVPAGSTPAQKTQSSGVVAPTARARLLLQRHGLAVDAVPHAGDRLTAEDIEHYVAAQAGARTRPAHATEAGKADAKSPEVAGEFQDLRSDERGVIRTVSWSREFAVPGYIEQEYDANAWEAYAKAYADRHRLMLSPLLALMAWRLVQVACATPVLNSTIVGDLRYQYTPVNLGFTVQAGETLYLTVVHDSNSLDETRFVNALGDIQRRAIIHKLAPEEIRGATISFSSMARWKVSRHTPVLPPYTAMIVAHAVSASGIPILGATYDHRVLNGFQVVQALRQVGKPTAFEPPKARES